MKTLIPTASCHWLLVGLFMLGSVDGWAQPSTVIRRDDLLAALLARLPSYTPVSAEPVKRLDHDEDGAADQPANGIVHLPVYLVHGRRPPIFRERDFQTERALASQAVKQYITTFDRVLNGHPLPFFGMSIEDRALALHAEDQRLRDIADLTDDARRVAALDPAGGRELQQQADESFMRRSDVGVEPR